VGTITNVNCSPVIVIKDVQKANEEHKVSCFVIVIIYLMITIYTMTVHMKGKECYTGKDPYWRLLI